jgi:hypothetical protein
VNVLPGGSVLEQPGGAAPTGGSGSAASTRPVSSFALRTFAVVGLVLAVVVWLSASFLDQHETDLRPRVAADSVLGGWVWYDAAWYVDIADHGYFYEPMTQSSVAFFPAYPLTVRAVSRLTGDTALAAILTTALCGAAVAWLFARWCASRLGLGQAQLAVLLLLLYPYGWFLYGAGYADALCLAATLVAFVLLDADRPLAAGLAGAVATAARPTGIAVVAGLVAVLVARRWSSEHDGPWLPGRGSWGRIRSVVRPRDLGVLASLSGVGSYCLYLWVRYADPVAFVTVQAAPGWDQPAGWRTWLKEAFFHHLRIDPLTSSVRLVAQAVLALVFLALIPLVWRRFGAGYGVYTLVAVGLPLWGAGDFQGIGRYLLGAFPVFAAVAGALHERRRASGLVVAVSATSLVVLCSLFASGLYLT